MKRILFLCFLFLQLLSHAQKSKYIPFPSKMISYGYIYHGRSDYEFYSVYRAEINGDTIFNGIHYSKYYLAEKFPDNENTNPYPNTSGTYLKFAGGIRNDLATKKVYLYSLGTNTEELLYDFDLKVGDTLFKNRNYGFYHSILSSTSDHTIKIDTAWVSRIDSVLMPHDGLYHKRFNFKASFSNGKKEIIDSDSTTNLMVKGYKIKINPLIEGVGFEYNSLNVFVRFEFAWELFPQCMSIDGQTVYYKISSMGPPPFIKPNLCNSIITGINENKDEVVATLYPNPSNGKFELLTHDLQNASFEITNILGTTILKSKIEKDKTEIDLMTQATGIYFIRIYTSTGLLTTKKIVIN
jgi:hypothetical protein